MHGHRRDIPRFFVDGSHDLGDVVELRGGDARKVTTVLRRSSGDVVEVCDSTGSAFSASLTVDGNCVTARLDGLVARPSEAGLEVVLAQAIPKGAKMDFVVEKATELGVHRIVPIVTERTIGDAGRASKVERWRRLARTAAQQSGRTRVPEVGVPTRWESQVAAVESSDLVLLPWELAERVPLRERLPPLLAVSRRVVVLVGPEGGITHAEAELAIAAGAHALSLGERILRTETAGLVVLSALLYAAGEI